MRAGRICAAAVVPLVAGAVGCGGGDAPPKTTEGKVVQGQTETGMSLKVETFIDPSDDPRLARLDAYRASARYPPVDYHRVTADNSREQVSDSGRLITFARDVDAIAAGQSVGTRFSCDVLDFEWIPQTGGAPLTERYQQLKRELCADGPPKQDGIPAGARKVYYLVTDRGFGQRGIKALRVFGPRGAELR